MKTPRKSDAGCQERAPAKLSALLTEAMLLLAVYQRGRDPFSMLHLHQMSIDLKPALKRSGAISKGQ